MDTRRKQRLSTVMNLDDFEDEFAPGSASPPKIVEPKNKGYTFDPEWQPETTTSAAKPKSSKPGTGGKRSRNNQSAVVISFSKKMKVKSTQSSEKKATLKRAVALKSKLNFLASSEDENDTSSVENSPKFVESSGKVMSTNSFSGRTFSLDFEKFVMSGGIPEDFWLLPNVKKRLSKIQDQVEYFEKQACNYFLDSKDIPWEELLKISRSLKVTPEMISAHFGKNVLTERRLRKGNM